jgi:hypothetical protein
MLALPTPATDPILLADWLELCALCSADRNYSTGDLERALESAGVLEADDGREALGATCLEVFHELEARAGAAGPAYPFRLHGRGLVEVAVAHGDFSPYVFCLCLSYFGETALPGTRLYPRRLFEDLACAAARNYVGGESVRFAFPRNDLPPGFRAALQEVCLQMGEGGVRTRGGTPGDAKLDVIAWRHFPDRHAGKLILFGQCASGGDWEEKLAELQPDVFCGSWFAVAPVSRIVKAFFTPHRVKRDDWEDVNRAGGLFFERCRLSYWVHNGGYHREVRDLARWSDLMLGRARRRVA